jgi:hypothetical protein
VTKLLRTLILILIIIQAATALASMIYIAEPVKEKDTDSIKTLISRFAQDGSPLGKIVVNGTFASVSPDGKHIIYVEQKAESPWEIALSDINGKIIRYLDIKKPPKNIMFPDPTKLVWSPDGRRIAIVFNIQNYVSIATIDLKSNELKAIYKGRENSSHAQFLFTVDWLADNNQILIAGSDGTRIINTDTRDEVLLSKESTIAFISGDRKKIIFVPQINELRLDGKGLKPPFSIYQYDTEKRNSELVMNLNIAPLKAVLSQTGRYLLYRRMQEEEIVYLTDLQQRKSFSINTKGYIHFPKKFSTASDQLVLCQSAEKNSDALLTGILYLDNGTYKVLQRTSLNDFTGESSMIYVMGFDWYDWR